MNEKMFDILFQNWAKDILTHYEHQLLREIHVLVLGLDVLGNPFGVIRSVTQGIQSFFYEPYQVN